MSDLVIARATSGTIPANSGNTAMTATSVSGYKFVAWVSASSVGWVGYVYASRPLESTSYFYALDTSGSARNISGLALYIRS